MNVVLYFVLTIFPLFFLPTCRNEDTPLMELPFNSKYGRWFLQFSINSQDPISEKINQELDYVWFKEDINTDKISPLKKGIVYFYSQEIVSNYYRESLIINNTQTNEPQRLNSFHFHFAEVKSVDINNGGAGMTFKFKDHSNSLVHQLYKEGLINQLIYSLVPFREAKNNKVSNGKLYLGGIPNDIKANKHSLKCNVNDKYSAWNCDLSYFIIGNDTLLKNENKYYHNTHVALFNVFESSIVAPQEFMIFLQNTLFKSFISNKECSYFNFNINQYFSCKNTVIPFFPSEFIFVINSQMIIFPRSILFDEYSELSYFKIVNYRNNKEKWVFGNIFFEQFDSVFNYQEQSVTLYSSEITFDYIQLPKLYSKRFWILFLVLLLIITLGLFLLRKKRRRKDRRNLQLITLSITENIK